MTTYENHTAMDLHMPITLRLATADDLPKLEWYGQYRHFRNLFRRTFREQQLGRRLMLIADANTFPIGHIFIQIERDSKQSRTRHAYFYSFRVMEMFRGRGIGTSLLFEAENRALEYGLTRATIAAAKMNAGARRLYERQGYQIYGEDDGAWSYVDHRGRICHIDEPCWLLEKYLTMR
ncbi:MAG: hypothetical protein CL610_19105 [Anaerolineaceae bacterium]|nr:hypothetical protein [Anaerolineaceae bacterium]